MTKLLPVILTTKRIIDKEHLGNLVSYRTLVSADDTDICAKNLPIEWLQYMKMAINNFYVARQTMDDMPDLQQYPLLTAITIQGEPMSHRSTKMLRLLKKTEQILFSIPVDNLPIRDRVWLTCVFCVKKDSAQFSLPDLCSGIVYDLTMLKILPKRKISTVFCLDGSKIVYTDGEPKTIVYVRSAIDT